MGAPRRTHGRAPRRAHGWSTFDAFMDAHIKQVLDTKMSNADRHVTSNIDPTKLMADTAKTRELVKSLVNNGAELDPTGHYKAKSGDNKENKENKANKATKKQKKAKKGANNVGKVTKKADKAKKGANKPSNADNAKNKILKKDLPSYCGEPLKPTQKSWVVSQSTPTRAAIEVNTTGQHFYLLRGPDNLKGFRQVSWRKEGGIDNAWKIANERKDGMPMDKKETINKKIKGET
jgi:hypothetical protein